ncbi:MAG TPA: DUF3795 domain-containing protein [Nitrospirota bacterium]|nr:DUF3795 domain-containing protein [Nitrospirota bacterium]
MKEIVADTGLVAYCGLYCGACRSYLRDRCRGCHENEKATWCKVRVCCLEQGYSSCAECTAFADPALCGKFNNFISKVVGFILRSDRRACILQIRERGLKGHGEDMALNKRQTIRS